MKDLTAVLPLVLVAAVFVSVCIAALRATDWRAREDRTVGNAGLHERAAAPADAAPADAESNDATAGTDDAQPPGPDPEIR